MMYFLRYTNGRIYTWTPDIYWARELMHECKAKLILTDWMGRPVGDDEGV